MSLYIVLTQVHPPAGDQSMASAERVAGDPEQFQVLGSQDAPSRRAAIKAATADLPIERKNGTFVAIPAAEWKPESRTVKLAESEDWG